MKVMTYNVCWEALEAVKTGIDMKFCKVKTKNKCAINISSIINNKLKQEYDFICLQEINIKQWDNISTNMALDNYNILKKEILPSGMLILYHNKYTLIKKYSGNLVDTLRDKRPYIISLFTNNIVVINIHMPHKQQYNAFIRLQIKLYKLKPYVNKHTIFIICGDFNNIQPQRIASFSELLLLFNQTINIEPYKINTCCVPNGTKYELSLDHIFISSNAQYLKYKTIVKKDRYMSDHLPLFCEIKI